MTTGFIGLPILRAGAIVRVATASLLPPNAQLGDVRWVDDVSELFGYGNSGWAVISGGGGGGSDQVQGAHTVWSMADGTTKTFVHGLASSNVVVTIIDLSDDEIIDVDSIIVTNSNTVTLTSAQAPSSSGWDVVVLADVGAGGGTVKAANTTWVTADGTTKTFAHGLGSININVSIIDLSTNEYIRIDSIIVTNSNTITLTASVAPGASGWDVTVLAD